METKDHLIISRHCLNTLGEDLSLGAKLAFQFGNIEPDINLFSYLKKKNNRLDVRGHHFPNSLETIRSLVLQLGGKKSFTVYDYYQWGVLMHYTADAFTHVHNQKFKGSMLAHTRYEHELHQCFRNAGQAGEKKKLSALEAGDVLENILKLHDIYEADERADVERDFQFIHKAAFALLSLMPQESAAYKRLLQKKRVICFTGREAA